MAHNGITYVNREPSGRGHLSGPFGSRRLPAAESVIKFTCLGATLLVESPGSIAVGTISRWRHRWEGRAGATAPTRALCL